MYIYTRGVVRVNLPIFNLLSAQNNPAFNGADALWKSLQNKMSNFINTNGGIASSISPTIYRPDWSKINDYIKGTKPISSLGCH